MKKTKNLFCLYVKIAFEKPILMRAIYVAMVVGIILNLINQGEKIFALDFEQINYKKFGFTFLVPYLVSTYSSTMSKIKFSVGEIAIYDAEIKCKTCGKLKHIYKGETIETCPGCNERTKWKLISKG